MPCAAMPIGPSTCIADPRTGHDTSDEQVALFVRPFLDLQYLWVLWPEISGHTEQLRSEPARQQAAHTRYLEIRPHSAFRAAKTAAAADEPSPPVMGYHLPGSTCVSRRLAPSRNEAAERKISKSAVAVAG